MTFFLSTVVVHPTTDLFRGELAPVEEAEDAQHERWLEVEAVALLDRGEVKAASALGIVNNHFLHHRVYQDQQQQQRECCE